MRRRMGLCIVLLLVLTACGKVTRTRGSPATPVPTRNVGAALRDALPDDPAETDAGGVTPGSGPASFAILLTDSNDLHPAGIPVKLAGPVTRRLESDADGVVQGSVPAGVYRFEVVAGCHETVYVTSGGSARVGIANGDTTRGTLAVIWQHRYGPGSPVVVDRSGDWPVGKTVTVRYAVADRCSENRAPGASFPTWAFDRSANLDVVKPPSLVADKDGNAHLLVSCTSKGRITLDAVDEANPTDRIDLVALAIGYSGVPRCV